MAGGKDETYDYLFKGAWGRPCAYNPIDSVGPSNLNHPPPPIIIHMKQWS